MNTGVGNLPKQATAGIELEELDAYRHNGAADSGETEPLVGQESTLFADLEPLPPLAPLRIAVYATLCVTIAASIVAPLTLLILFLSFGNLTNVHCLATESDWAVFWQRYSSTQIYPFWLCIYLITTRGWVVYESHRLAAYRDGDSLHRWARKWKVTRYIAAAVYALLLDLANLLWFYQREAVCGGDAAALAAMTRQERHILYNICYHTHDIQLVPTIMLHAAAVSLAAHFATGCVAIARDDKKLD